MPDDYGDDDDGFSFAGLIRTTWQNRWVLIAAVCIAVGLSAWQVQNETPLYTATSKVVLENKSDQMTNVGNAAPQRSFTYYTVNTELGVLRSSDLMLRTVKAMALEKDPEFNPALRPPPQWKTAIGYDRLRRMIGLAPESHPPAPSPEQARETAVDILNSKVSISNEANTLIVDISVTSEASKKSAAIANKIAELYIAGQREAKFEALNSAMGWLGKRVVELKSELESAETAVENFTAGAASLSPDAVVANTERLKGMRARQSELADAANTLKRRVDNASALRAKQDFAALANVIDDARVKRAARALAQLQSSRGQVERVPAGDPALVRFDTLFNRWLDGLRSDAARAEAQVKAASRSVAELDRQVEKQSKDLVTLRQMKREADATRLIYESFLGRLKEVSVQEGIQQADARILSRADGGYRSYPNERKALFKGGMIGLVLGLLLVSVRNAMRTSIQTPEELEGATGMTVIGVIPDDRIRRPDKLIDHIVEKSSSGTAEAVRNLRTGIQLSNIDVTPRVIVVTSSVPDEGKSILAAALAQTSAMSGKKVLLVDSDLRRRILREYFRMDPKGGLISLLSGQTSLSDTLQRDERTGLDVILADDEKVTPVDFFGSQNFEDFIAQARTTYDLVILDTPPVLAVPETRVIAQHADAIVYSVRWNSTTRRMVRAGLDLLRQVNLRVIGLALTRVDPRRMDRYGYYGYGYGARTRGLQKYYSD